MISAGNARRVEAEIPEVSEREGKSYRETQEVDDTFYFKFSRLIIYHDLKPKLVNRIVFWFTYQRFFTCNIILNLLSNMN